MGDLFHEDCPDEWIDKVFAVMELSPQHTFQVLTKRAARMQDYCSTIQKNGRWLVMEDIAQQLGYKPRGEHDRGFDWISHKQFLPNVWLGVSTERQQEADERIPLLLQTPAAIRFVSAEPLLAPIDLSTPFASGRPYLGLPIHQNPHDESWHQYGRSIPHLDWVIAGGESGPNARPMHPDWARLLRDQCAAAGVNYFFKQWGEWAPGECADFAPSKMERTATWFVDDWSFGALTPRESEETHVDDAPDLYRIGKKRAGRKLDGELHNGMPAVRA
jgi:protein gp37